MSAKSRLNNIKVLISKALIDSIISLDEIVLINNVLKEYREMKEGTRNLEDLIKFVEDFIPFIK